MKDTPDVKRLIITLFVLLCMANARATVFHVDTYSGTDDEKIATAIRLASAQVTGNTVDFGSRIYTITKPIVFAETPYRCLHFRGSGYWAQITYAGVALPPGKGVFEISGWKDSSMEDLCVRSKAILQIGQTPPDGFVFRSTGSSGRNRLVHCLAQGFNRGFSFVGEGNADMSVWYLLQCQATECTTGFYFVGDNTLGYRMETCTAAYCSTGFDFTGGSGSRLTGCGGSYNDVVFRVRGGFNMTFRDCETEVTKTAVYWLGGPGYDGSGQDTRISIGPDIDHRSISDTGYLLVAEKSGYTSLDLLAHNAGKARVRLLNLSDKPGRFDFKGDGITVESSGKWLVNGAAFPPVSD